jgi:type IV secretory pathway TrbD component
MTTHPMHASLVRPVLFGGAEPAAVAIEVLTAGALLFGAGFHLATFALASFYLIVVHGAMVRIARHDPQMSELYIRSLVARDYYPAHGAARAPADRVWPSIPSVA